MQENAARETPGAGSGQLQVIRTPVQDRRSMTVEVGGLVMVVSLVEMEFYCDLFEELFEELDRRVTGRVEDLEGLLDEFDRAEIEHLRIRYGTQGPF